jgi:hypothetical protein
MEVLNPSILQFFPKINYLNDTPSTKAAGGGDLQWCISARMSRYQSRSGGLWAQLIPLLPTVMSHNSSRSDPKLTSPVPKNHLVQSQNSFCHDHKSTSPVPKSDLRYVPYLTSSWLNIISSCPKSHLVLFHNSSCLDSLSTSPVPKSHPVCPMVHLIMT